MGILVGVRFEPVGYSLGVKADGADEIRRGDDSGLCFGVECLLGDSEQIANLMNSGQALVRSEGLNNCLTVANWYRGDFSRFHWFGSLWGMKRSG